jgi:hypothetical protein
MKAKNAYDEPTLICPECGSDEVTVTHEQMFMANTGKHWCHSVKTQDVDSKACCLKCRWYGFRQDLQEVKK